MAARDGTEEGLRVYDQLLHCAFLWLQFGQVTRGIRVAERVFKHVMAIVTSNLSHDEVRLLTAFPAHNANTAYYIALCREQ